MDRPGVGTRLTAGALAFWFGLVSAAPAMLHACPRVLAESAAQGAPASTHHHHGESSGSSQQTGLPQECTCLGTCATAGLAALPAATALPVAVVLPSSGGAIQQSSHLDPATPPAHLRPFATAPPLRSA